MRPKPITSVCVDRFVGTRLQLHRALAGQELADFAAQLNISVSQLRLYESGEERVPAAILVAAAQRLGTGVSVFFDGLDKAGHF